MKTKETLSQQFSDQRGSDLFNEIKSHFNEITETPTVSPFIALAVGPWTGPSRDLSQIVADLEPWWIIRALRVAAEENAAEDYKSLLRFLLKKLGVEPPAKVVLPSPGRPGAPKKQEQNDRIIFLWELSGKPKAFSEALASVVYTDYYRVDLASRKKRRDRCGRVIEKHIRRSGSPERKKRAEKKSSENSRFRGE